MAENPWRRRPLTENPYDWTAFQIVDMSPDVTARRAVNTVITTARKVLQALPGQRTIAGKAVELADITAASQLLNDPHKRMIEELFVHHSEPLQTGELRRFQALFTLANATSPDPLPVRHLHFLALLIAHLLDEAEAQLPPIEIPIPTLDPTAVPPFGIGGT
ncbi:MAG: hypothetical protein HYZ50_20170 [Deltaproteobacteria bacterium]|nr:hypothetical protein [Deltaproteobacteria bacterium]